MGWKSLRGFERKIDWGEAKILFLGLKKLKSKFFP
jgi:hypothetical protein